MPVQFTCPHCGQLLSVARRKVGQAVQCAGCHGGVIVPPPFSGDATTLPTATESPPNGDLEGRIETREEPMARPPLEGFASGWNAAVPVTRMALYSIGGLIVGVSIVSFLLGWAMGRATVHNQLAGAPSGSYQIHGRISYATNRGRTVADSESVVIALPVNQKPDEKFEISALRPDVPPPTAQHPTLQAIRSMGGDFARTNRLGDFRLEIPAPGEYFLLVVSSHLPRSESEPPTTKEIVQLGQYFKQADALLGKNDFVWSKELIRSEKRFDYRFQND